MVAVEHALGEQGRDDGSGGEKNRSATTDFANLALLLGERVDAERVHPFFKRGHDPENGSGPGRTGLSRALLDRRRPARFALPVDNLRHRLRFELLPKHKHQDPAYEQESDRWVADLRKAYDQIIEDTVLNGTVRRFNAHVRVRQLHGVKWTPDIAKRIDAGLREASPKAHHEALALHPGAHSPKELEAMLDKLDSLYQEMGGTPDIPPLEVPEEAEPVIRAVQRQV